MSKQDEEDFTEVAIPKFKMNYEVENMMQALQQLGMQRAFADGEFEKIAKNLYVDRVCHIAKVDVDEQGTKAAAVTSIMANDAMSIVEEEKVFIANEPFIFVIRDVENDMILFMGSMQNCE